MPISGRRSWNDELKSSSRQPRSASSRSASSSVRAARTSARSSSRSLPPTRTLPKRKRWPVTTAFSRRARSVSAANQLEPAARPQPAQTAAMSFRWLQTRSSSSRIVRTRASSGGGAEAERFLAGVRIGDRVGDGAGGARARRVREPVLQRRAFGGPLEAAVLVEEPDVDMEDPVADDAEAEVARLDHAGVDRPDRDVVRVVPAHAARSSARAARRGRAAGAAARGRRRRSRGGRPPRARPSRPPARGRRPTERARREPRRVSSRVAPSGPTSSVRTSDPRAEACRPPKRQPSASAAATASR